MAMSSYLAFRHHCGGRCVWGTALSLLACGVVMREAPCEALCGFSVCGSAGCCLSQDLQHHSRAVRAVRAARAVRAVLAFPEVAGRPVSNALRALSLQ